MFALPKSDCRHISFVVLVRHMRGQLKTFVNYTSSALWSSCTAVRQVSFELNWLHTVKMHVSKTDPKTV